MSRSVYGPRGVRRLQRQFPALEIVGAWSRGNTDHRIDLLLADGTIAIVWPGGAVQITEDRWSGSGEPADTESSGERR